IGSMTAVGYTGVRSPKWIYSGFVLCRLGIGNRPGWGLDAVVDNAMIVVHHAITARVFLPQRQLFTSLIERVTSRLPDIRKSFTRDNFINSTSSSCPAASKSPNTVSAGQPNTERRLSCRQRRYAIPAYMKTPNRQPVSPTGTLH